MPVQELKALVAQGRYLQVDGDAQRLIASGDLDEKQLAEAYVYWAIAKFRMQEFWGSLKLAERAMMIAAAGPGITGMAALVAGMNEIEIGDYAMAIDHLQMAMEQSQGSEDLRRQEGVLHHNMALAYRARRDWEKANMHYEFAAHVFSQKDEMMPALECYRGAAWCYLNQGDADRAEILIAKIEAYLTTHPDIDPQWYTLLLVDRAYVLLCRGESEAAINLCEEVSAQGRVGVNDEMRTEASWIAGEAALQLGHLNEAALFADLTIEWALKVQWPYMMSRGNDLRRRVFVQRGGQAESAS